MGKHKKELFAEIDVKVGLQNVDKVSRTLCSPNFKFEGNGRQYDFNASRLVEVSRAKELLDRGSTNVAAIILEQAEKSLKERNKIIRIADKYGWDVVEEYIDDPITENTDDATKLRQAEYRAKIKRREKVRQPQRTSPYHRIPDSERATSDLFRMPGATYSEEALGSKGAAATATRNVYSQSEYYGGKKNESTKCFYCNGEGYWAYQCQTVPFQRVV